ncbi:hypothetical protein TREMEDRAFT_57122, partial [Tremella mesenterica DSM 1558]|uniref:uncharacterized protein n=1 Tax=Tremella mesenterica (strain ATCC 24925 / CBS 8224 / DSM 1558 / NBRC 9311 / NRRL Y-6157 / RJB 2259-6 / UBC 559-6) TaxID=578456 RepID=UPI0003F49596
MAQHTHEHVISLTDILSESLLTSSSIPYTLDLNTPSARTYIDRLVGLPLDALVFEPSSISSQSHAIDSELVNLCFREYPTFISVHKCSAAVRVAIDDFDQSLSQLLDSVPALEQSCREFSTITSGIQKGREKASLVQEHQDKLVDLLEIPQLMETCVRNGYYQEALELASHVQEMGRRHENVLIQDVAMEVDSMLQLMLSQLLALLREPVKLPTLVKTIGYLRRLDKLDEDQLCLVFLISRLHNFRAQLVGIEKDRDDPVRYVRKYVDIFREHVYDIISQFSAIFVQPSGRHTGMEQLISFARLCVNDLSQLIKSYVPRMSSDSASMSSILIQLGYCALSFARVGMDFSSLVGAPFEEVVISVYTQSISSASITLFTLLDDALKSAKPPGDILITPDHLTNVLVHPTRPVVEDPQSPPPVFAHFPPLAQFVNAHLSALNALRLLAPLDCHSSISHAQSAAL